MTARTGPLAGITVIDVCRAGPGRMATGILADYGADVITIAEPGFGLKFSRQPASLWRGPTLLGMDTDSILRGLGYAEADTARFLAEGIIRKGPTSPE